MTEWGFQIGVEKGFFSRMKIIQFRDREPQNTPCIEGNFWVVAERASDKATFYAGLTFFIGGDFHDSMRPHANREFLQFKLINCFFKLEQLSAEGALPEEEIAASRGMFDRCEPSVPAGESKFSDIVPILESLIVEARDLYGATA